MQKIFINKETDMVEQILKIESVDELPDDYFSTCYAVLDEADKVNAYNLKYNKETKEFEVIIDVPAFDEVVVEKTPTAEDYNNLKEENEKLKKDNEELKKDNEEFKTRLEKVEELLNVR